MYIPKQANHEYLSIMIQIPLMHIIHTICTIHTNTFKYVPIQTITYNTYTYILSIHVIQPGQYDCNAGKQLPVQVCQHFNLIDRDLRPWPDACRRPAPAWPPGCRSAAKTHHTRYREGLGLITGTMPGPGRPGPRFGRVGCGTVAANPPAAGTET